MDDGRCEDATYEEVEMSEESPRIVIKLGEESDLVYLNIGDDEYVLDGETSRAVGEALYKTGCDSEAQAERRKAS